MTDNNPTPKETEVAKIERLEARIESLEKERTQYLEWYTGAKAKLIEWELRESARTANPEAIS